jgi:hypothetical protein
MLFRDVAAYRSVLRPDKTDSDPNSRPLSCAKRYGFEVVFIGASLTWKKQRSFRMNLAFAPSLPRHE